MPNQPAALRILETHRALAHAGEGPESVCVFSRGTLLYASFDHGREQLLDVSAHDRLDLVQLYMDWYLAHRRAQQGSRSHRTPSVPSQQREVTNERRRTVEGKAATRLTVER